MENLPHKSSLPEKGLVQNLAVAITPKNEINVNLIDKFRLNVELRKYKTETGTVNFPAIFSIPTENRIPALAKKDLGQTIKIIAVALTLAMESMNLKRAMTSSQIVDLAEIIVDSASEGDNISIEDLMLFLQKLTRGEYPELYESIDQVKFLSRFSSYRDERWEEGRRIRDEKHLEFKSMGDPTREKSDNPLDIHLSEFSGKIQKMKDDLRDKNETIRRIREDF